MSPRWLVFVLLLGTTYALSGNISSQENPWVKEISKLTKFVLDDVIQREDFEAARDGKISISSFDDPAIFLEDSLSFIFGYYVCAGIWVFLIFVVTLGGFITCCCRCCCSSKKDKYKERKRDGYRRRCCGLFLLTFTAGVLLGCVCMYQMTFVLGDTLTNEESNVFGDVASGVEALQSFAEKTTKELEVGSKTTLNLIEQSVNKTLNGIPESATDVFRNRTGIELALSGVEDASNDMEEGINLMNESFGRIDTLRVQADNLSIELVNLGTKINDAISSCTETICEETKDMVGNLTVAIAYPDRPNFVAMQNDLDLIRDTVYIARNESDMSTEIKTEISHQRQQVDDQLKETDKMIDKQISEVQQYVDNLGLKELTNDIKTIPEDQNGFFDMIIITCLASSGLITAIVGFYFFGVCFGSCCSRPKHRNDVCCTRKSGSNCLLVGLALFFVFYWIIALFTLTMFLAGGITHTAICRHVLKPDTMADDITNSLLELYGVEMPFNISGMYRKCSENEAVYQAMNLDSVPEFDLDKLLDINSMTGELKDVAKNIVVDTSKINLNLRLDVLDSLRTTSLDNISSVRSILSSNVTTDDLNSLLDKLNGLPISTSEVDQLVNITVDLQTTYVESIEKANKGIDAILVDASKYFEGVDVSKLRTLVGSASNNIASQGDDIFRKYLEDSIDSLLNVISDIVEIFKNLIRYETGRCAVVQEGYDTAASAACVTFLYPFNNLWFSTGWCLLFLIPPIFMAFALTDLYRKTIPFGTTSPNFHHNAGLDAMESQPPRKSEIRYTGPPPQGAPRTEPFANENIYIDRPIHYVTRPTEPLYAKVQPSYYRR